MNLYGLIRGREWVCLPRTTRRRTGALLDRTTGEPVWVPGLRMGPQAEAWVTPSLELALARARLLPLLPNGFAVAVRALPKEATAQPRPDLWGVGV